MEHFMLYSYGNENGNIVFELPNNFEIITINENNFKEEGYDKIILNYLMTCLPNNDEDKKGFIFNCLNAMIQNEHIVYKLPNSYVPDVFYQMNDLKFNNGLNKLPVKYDIITMLPHVSNYYGNFMERGDVRENVNLCEAFQIGFTKLVTNYMKKNKIEFIENITNKRFQRENVNLNPTNIYVRNRNQIYNYLVKSVSDTVLTSIINNNNNTQFINNGVAVRKNYINYSNIEGIRYTSIEYHNYLLNLLNKHESNNFYAKRKIKKTLADYNSKYTVVSLSQIVKYLERERGREQYKIKLIVVTCT